MRNSSYARAAIAQAALELVPPPIRVSLVDDADFKTKYGLSAEVEIAIGDSAIPMLRSRLFDAVRHVLGDSRPTEVIDLSGRHWRLRNNAEANELPQLLLYSGNETMNLSNLGILSPEPNVRLRSLNTVSMGVNLPATSRDTWSQILMNRSLEDAEVDLLQRDIHDTPMYVSALLRRRISAGDDDWSSIIPRSSRYYERLVGCYDGSRSIDEYADRVANGHLEQLLDWRCYEGFLLALVLSSHASITAKVMVHGMGDDELARCYEYIIDNGDVISRVGAIEVGVRILTDRPHIEPLVARLVRQIRDDGVTVSNSSFALLAGLFVLVDGEVSRTRVMCSVPPFYRRLASLAHASLIQRELIRYDVDHGQFYDWALGNRAEQYYMQSINGYAARATVGPRVGESGTAEGRLLWSYYIQSKVDKESAGWKHPSIRLSLVKTLGALSLCISLQICTYPDP